MKKSSSYTIVELHVPDFEKVKEFYGKLGFEIVWERPAEADKGYLVMQMDGHILCFWPGTEEVYNQPYFKNFPRDSKRGYGVELGFFIDEDIEDFYEKVKKFAKIVDTLETQPWGIKDFRLEDPFGYYLKFSESYDTLDPKFAVK